MKLLGAAIEVWKWISNFISHFIMDIIIYPWRDLSKSMLGSGISGHNGYHFADDIFICIFCIKKQQQNFHLILFFPGVQWVMCFETLVFSNLDLWWTCVKPVHLRYFWFRSIFISLVFFLITIQILWKFQLFSLKKKKNVLIQILMKR